MDNLQQTKSNNSSIKYLFGGLVFYFAYSFFQSLSKCHDTFSMAGKYCSRQYYDTTVSLYIPQIIGLLLILSFVVYKRNKNKGINLFYLIAGIVIAIIIQKFI